MNTFKNIHFTKRDYECTNFVACRATIAPSADWAPCDASVLFGLTQLETRIQSGSTVQYWGYL